MAKLKIGDYNTLTVLKVALREGNRDPFGCISMVVGQAKY